MHVPFCEVAGAQALSALFVKVFGPVAVAAGIFRNEADLRQLLRSGQIAVVAGQIKAQAGKDKERQQRGDACLRKVREEIPDPVMIDGLHDAAYQERCFPGNR